MTGRNLELDAPALGACPAIGRYTVRLVSPPNWTAVCFLATLGLLHLCIAVPASVNLRWEAYMSLALGVTFLLASLVTTRIRSTVEFDSPRRQIRIHNGIGRYCFRRRIPFDDVHAVRLTITRYPDHPNARIEVLCDNEDIECSPTELPRQEALCLAVLLNVQLIKVCPPDVATADDPDETWRARRAR